MAEGRNWRGGTGSDDSALTRKVDRAIERHTYVNDEVWPCEHPYCDVFVQPGEFIYRARLADRWYCSKLCRERHTRILVQQRRRTDPVAAKRDRSMKIQRKYGVPAEWWDSQYDVQGGRCAVCREPLAEGKGTAVDHDHACCPGVESCGKCVRGLLCSSCNGGLGFFQDDVMLMRAAIAYLESFKARESAPSARSEGR